MWRLGASENTYVKHLWPAPTEMSKQLGSANRGMEEFRFLFLSHLHDLCPVKTHQVTKPIRAVNCTKSHHA